MEFWERYRMSHKKKEEVKEQHEPVAEDTVKKPEPRKMTFICEVWTDTYTSALMGFRFYTNVRLACGNVEATGSSSSGYEYAFADALSQIKEKAALERFAPETK